MPPQAIPKRGALVGEVLQNRRLCDGHYALTLGLEKFPPTRPGQFVQLQCRRPGSQQGFAEAAWPEDRPPKLTQPELAEATPLLRRPFSLAGRRDLAPGVEIDIIYHTIGTGTHWLAHAGPGDRISVLGPLGNGFCLREGKPAAALIGGGVGIPPMIYLAEALRDAGKRSAAFCGARTAGLLPLTLCAEEFAAFDTPAVIATDDGSAGFAGFVSEAFEAYLADGDAAADELAVYCCGPEPLMRAVADICLARGIDCQLALERYMACGMGTCQSCVVKIRDDSPAGWGFKLCCTDGPVFDAREIIW